MAAPRLTTAPDAEGRGRILDAAATLFVQQGFAATSLRHIAAASGMKAGSIYYHFESKDELLEVILQRGMTVMVEAFEAAAAATVGADARVRVGAHVRAHLGALFENGPYTAAHITSFRTAPPAVHDAIVPRRDAYESMWAALFDELVARAEISQETPTGLARLILFGAMNSSVEWFDLERGNLDQLADVIAEQFLTGVAP